ncbi:MAG: hypothetical protein M3P98_04565 [bacterium]|nr:hypothetical protein [bacterium]
MPKKNIKSKSNKKSIWSKLKPNTGIKKLVYVVVIFAVIGGGVYAYRSFAASGTRYSAGTFAGGTPVYGTNAKGKYVKYRVINDVSDSNKNSTRRKVSLINGRHYTACWKASSTNARLYAGAYNTSVFSVNGNGKYVQSADGTVEVCTNFTIPKQTEYFTDANIYLNYVNEPTRFSPVNVIELVISIETAQG